ncbi:hypothetical protein D3C85_743120 [compost metagenome]
MLVLDRVAQVLQQLQLPARISVHRRIEEPVTVLAGALGVIHRRIGIHQQLLRRCAVAGIDRDTDAGGDLQIVLPDPERTRDQPHLPRGQAQGIVRLGELHQQHELVPADARQGVLAAQILTQAHAHLAQQLVAHMVTKGVVHRLEAVQVNEHQRKAAALLLHPLHGQVDTVGQQHAVGQPGERVVQGQLGQFTVGQGQGIGQLGGTRLKARIEDGGQQRDAQHRQSGDQYQVVQALAAQAIEGGAAKAAVGELRGSHPGVVHANDGNAHDDRRPGPGKAHVRGVLAQPEGDPQCRGRCPDGNRQRGTEQGRGIIDAGSHAQGGHAGVVHGTDPGAHDQGTKCQLPGRQAWLANQPQGKATGHHRNHQRQRGDCEVIAQVDRQTEGQHANEVHGPDPDPHGQGATGRPQVDRPPLGRGNTPGQVQCRIGRKYRYAERDKNQGGGIATDEHQTSRQSPTMLRPCSWGESGRLY